MLIDVIAADRLEYRKRGKQDPKSKFLATTLTTLYGEARMIGKNDGGREVTDEELIKVLHKFIKGVRDKEKYALLMESELDEIALYQSYLPILITEKEILEEISYLGQYVDHITIRDMGRIIKSLKVKYPGRVDGKFASAVIKENLR